MAWKKLRDCTGQKIVGDDGIELCSIRDGKVWHQHRKLTSADAETFEVFENQDFLARDALHMYHAWSKLTKVDRNSFWQSG